MVCFLFMLANTIKAHKASTSEPYKYNPKNCLKTYFPSTLSLSGVICPTIKNQTSTSTHQPPGLNFFAAQSQQLQHHLVGIRPPLKAPPPAGPLPSVFGERLEKQKKRLGKSEELGTGIGASLQTASTGV